MTPLLWWMTTLIENGVDLCDKRSIPLTTVRQNWRQYLGLVIFYRALSPFILFVWRPFGRVLHVHTVLLALIAEPLPQAIYIAHSHMITLVPRGTQSQRGNSLTNLSLRSADLIFFVVTEAFLTELVDNCKVLHPAGPTNWLTRKCVLVDHIIHVRQSIRQFVCIRNSLGF